VSGDVDEGGDEGLIYDSLALFCGALLRLLPAIGPSLIARFGESLR
jgi:hypothetical protein